jgi:cytochrome c5
VTETVDDLAAFAHDLLGRSEAPVVGLWQRAVSLLARQALETAVAAALAARAAGAERCPARAQLLCLPSYVSTDAALEAAYLWSVLSRACHQHAYELAPTWDELARWLERVEGVAATIRSEV